MDFTPTKLTPKEAAVMSFFLGHPEGIFFYEYILVRMKAEMGNSAFYQLFERPDWSIPVMLGRLRTRGLVTKVPGPSPYSSARWKLSDGAKSSLGIAP